MTAAVVELSEHRRARMEGHPSTGSRLDYDGRVCSCGSPWWIARVAVGPDGNVTGYDDVPTCARCRLSMPT